MLAGGRSTVGELRTDLALEATQHAQKGQGGLAGLPGVRVEERRHGDIVVHRVDVLDEEGERATGKARGHYVTLDTPGVRNRDRGLQEQVARALAEEIRRMLPIGPDAHVLVVGLGNWNATPDALGPRVVDNLLVTRHLQNQVPADLRGGLRPVSAIAPGVLGLTGIETTDIIAGIVKEIRPDAVLAVDALAARSIRRICSTIQLADTGIRPGSGVGNDRGGISRETLGVEHVLAIGVPTVVHAFTIASDTVDLLIESLRSRPGFGDCFRNFSPEQKNRLIEEVLSPTVGDLMVTPKEIDVIIEDMSRVVAAGINAALHPRVAEQPTLVF
ncbi:MAG: GPR endopeptidase [Firmicutes bacterium]|nr:GPR endopeptidase [Bacillota bacterium]